jgi:glycine cleavage system pyridoxal-binding protein P
MRRRELLLAGAAAARARPAAAVAPTLQHDGDVIKPLIAREEAARFAYRGAVPRGAPDLAQTAADHAKALRTQLQALGRGTTPITADDLDPLTRRFSEASTPGERLNAAIALEADLVATYRKAVIALTAAGILQTTATILAGHSQQHALLARLAGRDPF